MKTNHKATILLTIFLLSMLLFTTAAAEKPECSDIWLYSWTLELPPNYWSEGAHHYEYVVGNSEITVTFSREIWVTPDASVNSRQVRLGPGGLAGASSNEINPAQDTFFQVTQALGAEHNRADIVAFRADSFSRLRWDGGDWIEMKAGPIVKMCSWNDSRLTRNYGPPYVIP